MTRIALRLLSYWWVLAATVAVGAATYSLWPAASQKAHTPPTFSAAAYDPLICSQPRHVAPTADYVAAVRCDRLKDILLKLRPQFYRPHVIPVSYADHSLRLWGTSVTFQETALPVVTGQLRTRYCFSPSRLFRLLTDNREFAAMYPVAFPLLEHTNGGIAVRFKPVLGKDLERKILPDCESHTDHFLSVFGECGVAVAHPVHAYGGDGSLRDLLYESMWRFSWEQELEFTTAAYLHYLKLPASWQNRFGQEVSVDGLVHRIATKGLSESACLGTHACQTLALAARIDADTPFLTPQTRTEVRARLRLVSGLLDTTATPEGAWTERWLRPDLPRPALEVLAIPDAIRATGHHLEWIAIAPGEVCPAERSVKRAIGFLENALVELTTDYIVDDYPPVSHAGRALALLANVEPFAFVKDVLMTSPQPALSPDNSER
jgi:hypothetical protein